MKLVLKEIKQFRFINVVVTLFSVYHSCRADGDVKNVTSFERNVTVLTENTTISLEPEILTNRTLRLRKSLKDTDIITEVECAKAVFMSPFHFPFKFSANSSIGERNDPTCTWNFVGTEPCLPTLSCSSFTVPCNSSSLQVTDGMYGLETYCGDNKPEKVTASTDLRDLYVTLKGSKDVSLECTVTCGRRGSLVGKPLGKEEMKINVNPGCRCGVKPLNNRIVGGELSLPHEFPWLAVFVGSGTRQPFCAGSIINDRMIITAGHCFKGRYLDINNVEVILNGHLMDPSPNLRALHKDKPKPKIYTDLNELARLDATNGSVRFSLEEIFIHPLHESVKNDFDVGIVRLSTPIDFKTILPQVSPICLPELPLNYMRTYTKNNATVAGWGLSGMEALWTSEVPYKVQVQVFSPTECKRMYGSRVNRRMLCSGSLEEAKDSCGGDSGGPLVVEDNNKVWYAIGSVSWGDGCAKPSITGVYFRMTESGQWLRHVSNQNNAVWCEVPE